MAADVHFFLLPLCEITETVRWWANVTSRETVERSDSPYGDVLPHWDKDESLQRSSSAPTCAGCFACAARPARALILKMYG
jgi:hypothetical protein